MTALWSPAQGRRKERKIEKTKEKGERLNVDDACDDAFQFPSNKVSCPYSLTFHFPCKEKGQFTSREDFAANNNSLLLPIIFFTKGEDNAGSFPFFSKYREETPNRKMQTNINKSITSLTDTHIYPFVNAGKGIAMSTCSVST